MRLTSPTVIKQLMDKYEIHFNKRFGQNFLIDEHFLADIVDEGKLTKDDTVLEIGPGIGTMTRALSEVAGRVITVEIDQKLIPVLHETLADCDNVTLINADFLKLDLAEVLPKDKPVKVVANLPYYITTPIIMTLLQSGFDITRMVFLVQKEVGERICAEPGNKTYGALSVYCQYYADPRLAFTVPATVFMPRPNVDSVVIRMAALPDRGYAPTDEALFFKTVKAAFANRRKTLINSLSANLKSFDKPTILQALESADIDPKIRAEKLYPEDFCAIANALAAAQNA